MGWKQFEAAEALGVARETIVRREQATDDLPREIELACKALEAEKQ